MKVKCNDATKSPSATVFVHAMPADVAAAAATRVHFVGRHLLECPDVAMPVTGIGCPEADR